MSNNQCSETNSDIAYHLDCLIKIFQELKKNEVNNIFYTKQEIIQNLLFFTNKKDKIERILELNTCSDRQHTHVTQTCCEHEFVNDYIDLTPEKSERILYCRFCCLTL